MQSQNLPQFPSEFEGDIVTPSDPAYPQAIDRWAINAVRKAKLVAFVKTPKDVALALRYAKETKTPVAIRSGGHSCSGASSVEDGIVIDLSRYMNTVTIERLGERYPELCKDGSVPESQMVATIGGGALWRTVDEEAIKKDMATPGGMVNHTGVSGLTFGGGIGWLMGRHGLVIDNLLKANMVLADGSIVEASHAVNPDLFWGIRGGGCNFGVVTSFVLKVHPQRRNVFAGLLFYPPDSFKTVTEALEQYQASKRSPDEAALLAFARLPDGRPEAVVALFFNGSATDGKAKFKSFFDIEHLNDTTGEIPYEKLNSIMNSINEPGLCCYWSGTTQQKLTSAVQLSFNDYIQKSGDENPHITLSFHVDCHQNDKFLSGQGEGCFPVRTDCSYLVAQAMWKENTPENAAIAKAKVQELVKLVKEQTNNANLSDSLSIGYSNFHNEEPTNSASKEKAKNYFGDNYDRLAQLKRKYDPDVVFDKFYPIIPA